MAMKYAICQELFEGWDWARQVRAIAEIGYTGIEVAPFTLAERIQQVGSARRTELRKVAADHGLEIIGLHWLLAKTTGFHLTTRDAAVRRATADYLGELASACADLGGSVLVFGSPAQRNRTEGQSFAEAVELAADTFRMAMPRFEENNVLLCLEPLTPKETDFLTNCAEAVQVIERTGSKAMALHQDVKAMLGGEQESIPVIVDRYKSLTRHFHVNDSNLLGPGMGDTDFRPILQALHDSNYDGWVSVEVFDYSPGAEEIARVSLATLRAAEEAIVPHRRGPV